MKKRLLAILLAAVLVFSMLPGVVIAEGEEHVHCLCGNNTVKNTLCADCGSEAMVWNASAAMPTASGNYYLTGPVSAGAQFLENVNINLCLHGQTVTSAAGKKFLYLNKNVTYNITDCSAETVGDVYTAGGFTGVTGVDTYGSTMRVNASCVLNLYDGKIFNNTAKDSGILYVDGSSSASVAGGTFNMYGGEISGNTCRRGTVYGVSTGTNKPVIRILGGVITGNNATGNADQTGGGGICAFSPVEVGGTARIFGNTASLGGADIYLRNDGSFTGALVISSEVPLEAGAQIAYSLYTPESNSAALQKISGAPETWDSSWVSYDNQKVGYKDGKFFVDLSVDLHIHCLCGATTVEGETCPDCGSEAVVWEAAAELSKTSGYYYLNSAISTGAVVPTAGAEVNICLHGHNITSAAGKKIWYVSGGAQVILTDCAENAGQITGCKNEPAVQVATDSVFIMYGGKFAGNTTTGDGVILLEKGNATKDGGAFVMYGGEISGNTVKRGTITMTNAPGTDKNAIVRLLGGTITGNHATGTATTTGGGAGILAMGPVEIGGDAKIYGNTAVAGPADIYIRNDQKGALIISSEVPLTDGAQVAYGLYTAESNPLDLQYITGAPANWNPDWVSLDGDNVCYADGKFYLESGYANAHIHCLCGAESVHGEVCPDCGSEAVVWAAVDSLPKAAGYYYLSKDISTGAVVPTAGAEVNICLHGHNITSAAGKKIWYVSGGAQVTVTDCAENAGQITGCQNEPVVQVAAESAFVLHGGKLCDNTTTGDGVILLEKGDDTKDGGAFAMYGGEISGNTVNRGTITMTNAPGTDKNAIVRILGGTITGNHATGTSATIGGGAGILAMGPVEVGGDAKIYGNTAVAGPADIYIRNDQKGALIISDEIPLTDGAQIACGLYVAEADPYDLQTVTGAPTAWSDSWITYDGGALRYEDGKFSNAKKIIYSTHAHDGKQWISLTAETGLLPERTGYYVLDADLELPREIQLQAGQNVVLCLNGHDLTVVEGVRHFEVLTGASLTICDCTAKTVEGKYIAGAITGAKGTYGGGAIRLRPGATVNLYSGKISGNRTKGEGGAFYLDGCLASATTPAVLNMYGGEISDNTADKGYGGAIRMAGAVEGQMAATFHMEGGTISGNKAPNYGGALHAPGYATIELLGGVIEKNEATAGGGAISINGLTTVNLKGTIIRNNSAAKWGGGIYLKTGASLNMESGEISGNSSKIGAGVLLENEGTNMTLSGGKICGNAAGTAGGGGVYVGVKCRMTMDGGEICGNTSKAGGAGISIVTSEFTMNGGSICHNEATSWGAGMLLSTDAKFVMNGGKIEENYTPKSAAGIYAWCAEIEMNKGSVSNNVAEDTVGGIRLVGSKLTMNGGSVSGNLGNTGSGAGVMGEQAGRTIDGVKRSIPSHIVMNGGSVSYNKAAKAAAGVLIQSKGSSFVMYGGTISHNHAGKFAGAVYVGAGSVFNMSGGEICYNTMEADGAAGVYHAGNGNYTGGAIHHNSTPKSGAGIAISGEDTVVHAKNLKIYENTAKVAGGVVIQSKATLHMENCEIYNNTASLYGGGVYIYTYTTVTMKDCKLYNNRSEVDGGGIWMWATSHLIMDGCELADNQAVTGQGGGIWTRADTVTLRNCVVRGNTAAGQGGGLFAGMMGSATLGYVEYITMENVVIQNNQAGKQGGGIFLSQGSKAKMYNTQLLDNQAAAEGGALWAKEDLTMQNVTVTGNTSGGEGYAVYLADSDYDGFSYFAGQMRMSGDMQIIDNNGGDLYLGKKVPVAFDGDGLGQNAKIHVNMHSGLLTQWVWGSYHYEGSDGDYIITYGDRSVKEPQYAEEMPEEPAEDPTQEPVETPTEGQQEQPGKGNGGLIVGIGAVAAVILAAAAIIVVAAKKKKAVK